MQKYKSVTTFAFVCFGVFALFLPQAFAQSRTLASDGTAPVYRFYNDSAKHHFYTISEDEKEDLIQNDTNWSYEGVAYNSYVQFVGSSKPLHRFYSPSYKGHFYTTSEEEKESVIQNDANWNYEGIAYYVKTEGTPVYRFYSKNYRGHFYTTSEEEKESIIQNDANWNYEGIAYYSEPLDSRVNPFLIIECGNGLDDDSDGLLDFADPDCDRVGDLFEQAFITPSVINKAISVRARGNSGLEVITLMVNGAAVRSWQLSTDYQTFSIEPNQVTEINEIKVSFDNDAVGLDALIDHVKIGNIIYESEDPLTYSEGTYVHPEGCISGNTGLDELMCNGYFRFDQIPEGIVAGTIPEGGYCHDTAPYGDGTGFNTAIGQVCFLTSEAALSKGEDENDFCFDNGVQDDGIGINNYTSEVCYFTATKVTVLP